MMMKIMTMKMTMMMNVHHDDPDADLLIGM